MQVIVDPGVSGPFDLAALFELVVGGRVLVLEEQRPVSVDGRELEVLAGLVCEHVHDAGHVELGDVRQVEHCGLFHILIQMYEI